MGLHVSKGKSKSTAVAIEKEIKDKEITCAQIYTHGPRNKSPIKMEMKEFKSINIPIYVHASYSTILSTTGIAHIKEQLDTASLIGAKGLIIHIPRDDCKSIADICSTIDKSYTNGLPVPIILELTAMKPSAVSYESAAKLKALAAAVSGVKKVGICIDTAHLFSCDVNITTADEMKTYLADFDQALTSHIKLIHFNGNRSSTYHDTHTFPGSTTDLIWGKMKIKESGAKVLYDWAITNHIDMVIEPGSTTSDDAVAVGWKTITVLKD